MAKRRIGLIAFWLCFCLCLTPCVLQVASAAEIKEPISTEKECSLTITYGYDGTVFAGQSVELYKVAEVSADALYSLTAPFADSKLILNGIQTQGEWNVIRSTLETLVLANQVTPLKTAVTNASGQACFTQLSPGLYLVLPVNVVQETLTCCFDAVLVALPGLEDNGRWQYQITVAAKPQALPPIQPDEELQLKVLKLWKDGEGSAHRPQSIEVEIFRDGTSYQTVILSEENNWSYSWSAKKDGASWKVVERNIPTEYVMTVEERSSTFILTNTLSSDTPVTPPLTGDSLNLLLYIIPMLISGSLLMIVGITGKRERL